MDWRERERARMLDGTYKPVPWAREEWWERLTAADGPLAEHYAHASTDDGAQVAFTENAAKGERDRQTRMKPGRYLNRFCAVHLSPDEIRDWAGKFAAEYEGNCFLLAESADEIERVYLNGPSSCMSHSASSYDSSEHPTRAYAAGDLAVAYLQREDEITARAVVWPARKIHSRIYGDGDRLRAALEEAGYEKGSLSGARLVRQEEGSGFLCPYIDGEDSVGDNGTHLIIGDSGLEAGNTSGITFPEGTECEHCGDRYDSDDVIYYECVNRSLCEDCAGELVSQCSHCEEMYDTDDVQWVRSLDRSICTDCLRDNFALCVACDEWHDTDDVQSTSDGDVVCQRCLERDYAYCDRCDEWNHETAADENGHCSACALAIAEEEASAAEEDSEEDSDTSTESASERPAPFSVVQPIPIAPGAGGPGFVMVRAWASATAGLVVSRSAPNDSRPGRRFVVTHVHSGLSTGLHYDSRETAMRAADRLGGFGIDWTLAADVLTILPHLDNTRRAVNVVRDEITEAR